MIKPGDRVRPTKGKFCGIHIPHDNLGTVVIVKTLEKKYITAGYAPEVGVQFDRPITDGHACGGWENGARYKDGHCRWGNASELIILSEGEEVIPVSWIFNGRCITGMTPIPEEKA